jgi:hypothetical protein
MEELIKQLSEFIQFGCPSVLKMQRQLTTEQAKHLLELYPLDDVKKQLAKMDNWKELNKKCNSVYLTCLKWFEMDIQRGFYKAPAHANQTSKTEADPRKDFFRRFEVGSRVAVNGNTYEVEENCIRNIITDNVLPIMQAIKLQNLKKITNY